jgi:hypothetical protein
MKQKHVVVFLLRLIGVPVAKYFNIKEKSTKNFKSNSVLEVYFRQNNVEYSESIYLVNRLCLIFAKKKHFIY